VRPQCTCGSIKSGAVPERSPQGGGSKKMPIIGRVVATPNAMATIRVAHSRWSSRLPFRMCRHALTNSGLLLSRRRAPGGTLGFHQLLDVGLRNR
jgi:hypothetical protein